ncbi:MAG: hypothetical protein JRJ03_12985 [Deltaproteobacteria bacterium]|nr:hypothetical protein [Deltaproteobacteria bacterium]
MTPLSFEWQWNIDYFLFMGFLYLTVGVVGCGILYAVLKTWVDLSKGREEGAEEAPPEISYRARYREY